jgi:hypothetical protein
VFNPKLNLYVPELYPPPVDIDQFDLDLTSLEKAANVRGTFTLVEAIAG